MPSGAPVNARTLPGMPLQMMDPDDEDLRFGARRPSEPAGPWWRPSSTMGRVFLGLGALIVLGTFTAGVLAVKSYLGRDSRFRIAGAGNIEASGLTEVSRAEILPIFGEDIGRNIFFVPLNERRKQLEAIPWVQHATVMRLLPDHIRVSVVERHPVAFVRHGSTIGLVDAEGVLLSMPAATMAQHHYSFPVVTGIDPRDPLAARTARMAVYERMLAELDANNQHLSQQISEIDLTDPQDARVFMPEQGSDILAHFGDDRFLERYQRYKAHIAEWRQQYAKLAAVDLRYDSQVVLEMTPGTNAVAAAIGPTGSTTTDLAAVPPAKPSAGTTKSIPPPAPPLADTSAAAQSVKAEVKTPVKAEAKTPENQVAAVKPTAPSTREAAIEALAAKQRAAHERAARLKAAHQKALKKKHAASQHTAALNASGAKPSTRTSAAQGQ